MDQTERAKLRAQNRVTLIDERQEGTPIRNLPPGCFGYTASPAADGRPLFRKPIYQGFEIQKLDDGSAHLVGYVTEGQAERLAGRAFLNCRLYPEPFQDATTLVSIPLDRVIQMRGPSRDAGNYLTLEIRQ